MGSFGLSMDFFYLINWIMLKKMNYQSLMSSVGLHIGLVELNIF